jgi:hypothetical protein
MKKLFTVNTCRSVALALAAFAAAGAVPAFAQSSGTWSAGISARNGRPFVPASKHELSQRGYYGTPYGGGPQYDDGGGDQYGYGPGYSYARQAPSR